MIGWTIGGSVHRKSSVRKVTHLTYIPTIGDLTLELPWDPTSGRGFKPPSSIHDASISLIVLKIS